MNQKIELIECTKTFQGEGPNIGKKVILTRFKLCNKSCPYCDTKIKMRVSQEMIFSLESLQKIIDENKSGIMITGGEPTYNKNLKYTINMLNNLNYSFADVETNGYDIKTLLQNVDGFQNINFIISPKIFEEYDLAEFERLLEYLFNDRRIFFKLVVPDVLSKEILDLIQKHNYIDRTYLMPKGKTKKELEESYPYVLGLAEEYLTNITTRMHLTYDII
jgi:organic radical activating enzyme